MVKLREIRASDEADIAALRRTHAAWLTRWDATSPVSSAGMSFAEMTAKQLSRANAGEMLPLVIEVEGGSVGQLNVSNIVLGSFRSCTMGYWISQDYAGRAITPTAVALAGDHCLGHLGLHRIEINIRPENESSLAVVRKLAFRDEGLRRRMLHIDGDWRDHRSFAITTEDLAESGDSALLVRLHRVVGEANLPH